MIGSTVLYKIPGDMLDSFPNGDTNVCPAVVVRVWTPTCVNLRLMLDGDATPRIMSAIQGDADGQWQPLPAPATP